MKAQNFRLDAGDGPVSLFRLVRQDSAEFFGRSGRFMISGIKASYFLDVRN